MENLGTASAWGFLIWISLVGGALVATATRLPERVAALITAFGGGALLAAVAFGLVAGMVIYVSADA